MPSGSKKRKAAKKKEESQSNNNSTPSSASTQSHGTLIYLEKLVLLLLLNPMRTDPCSTQLFLQVLELYSYFSIKLALWACFSFSTRGVDSSNLYHPNSLSEVMSQYQAVSFGKSLIVPSVQELSKQGIANIPPRYVRHDGDSPGLPDDDVSQTSSIPVVDLHALLSSGQPGNHELQKLHLACQEWGFFQIIHHGISASLVEKLRTEVAEFFRLPMDEKKKLWQQPDNHEGFGQLFVVSEEQKLDWADMFYISTLPITLRNTELFQKLPVNLRETTEAYSAETKRLALTLLGQLAKALKIDDQEMKQLFDDGLQTIRMNYYPPCPQPDKAIGFTPHSDADALTILLQLNDTEGLQIRKDGIWVPVRPRRDAFVVNLGDMMEIVSNGVYRSIEHRATVNSSKERLSLATFYSCSLDSELGPARSLLGAESPPVFRRTPVDEYFKEFFARKLNGKAYVDLMRLESPEIDDAG